MKKPEIIMTMRKTKIGKNFWWDQVYEWEDVFCNMMHLNVQEITETEMFINNLYRRLDKFLNIKLPNRQSTPNCLIFEMGAFKSNNIYNKQNIIPVIIDYLIPREKTEVFLENYCNCDLVLISNRNVYEYLKDRNLPVRVKHFPLSLADQWMLWGGRFEKQYDVVLAGRQSQKLLQYLLKYIRNHDKVRILVIGKYRNEELEKMSGKGLDQHFEVRSIGNRQEYMGYLRQSRVMLYTTAERNGWSWVTPRFLEGIVSQCHILCEYEENEDTNYWQLRNFSVSCDSYDKFEEQLDFYLKNDVDLKKYSEYLNKHLTSKRVELLNSILNEELIYV